MPPCISGVEFSCLPDLQTKHLEVVDVESADLLSHLPELCDFIDQARAAGGAVYVHCAAGVSRSATVSAKTRCDPDCHLGQCYGMHHSHTSVP